MLTKKFSEDLIRVMLAPVLFRIFSSCRLLRLKEECLDVNKIQGPKVIGVLQKW
jgi:hypothetical protein